MGGRTCQPDGDLHAGDLRQARCSNGEGSRSMLPRLVSEVDALAQLVDERSCHRRLRPGRGARKCRRSEEHTSELQSLRHLVCRLLLEKKKNKQIKKH